MNESVVRTLSGIVYIVLLVAATLYSPISFMALFGIFMLVAIQEFCKLAKIRPLIPLISGAVLLLSYSFNLGNQELTLVFTAIGVAVNCVLIYELFTTKSLKKNATLWGAQLTGYIIMPFLLLLKLPFLTADFNPTIIIGIFILIWTNDTFAYIVGKTMGRTKLFERISPKKTVEGFLGGLVFAIIGAYVISLFEVFGMTPLLWISTGVILVITGTIGDLIESRLKRYAGVKDSGKIMPGHGGILDRLDSIIFAIPFLFLFYQIINYVS